MSTETWSKEFYPIPANKVKGVMNALRHAERKWIGYRLTNLKKHGMARKDGFLCHYVLTDGKHKIVINANTCALCQLFPINCYNRNMKTTCPIWPCYGSCGSPCYKWITTGNPEPMIRKIRRAIKKLEGKK